MPPPRGILFEEGLTFFKRKCIIDNTVKTKRRRSDMNPRKMLVAAMVSLVAGGFSLFAQNILENGAFEEGGRLDNIDALAKNGCKIEFAKDKWAKGWIINEVYQNPKFPSVLAFGKDDTAKRFFSVKATDKVHVYTSGIIAGISSYKGSFKAKGEAFEGKSPRITMCSYLYTKEGRHAGKENKVLGTFELGNEWKTYTFEIPELGEEFDQRLAIEFVGGCEIAELSVEMK